MTASMELDDDEKQSSPTQYINAVIIGNVNAGKSSLCGRIAYHLGLVSGSTLLEYRAQAQELQRESYYLAWWSDRAIIEREKGITIHNHFHCWSFPERNLAINVTDISGYEYYLKNAIVGCALNQVAILLVDINDQFDICGAQELPTQKYMGAVLQQLLIIKAMNIGKILVVLNKCDLFLNHLARYKTLIGNIRDRIVQIATNLALDLRRFHPFIIPISTMFAWNICDGYTSESEHFLVEHSTKCMQMDESLRDIHQFCALRNPLNGDGKDSAFQRVQDERPQTLLDVVSNLRLECPSPVTPLRSLHHLNRLNPLKATVKRVTVTKKHLLLLYCIVVEGMISVDMRIRVHPYNISMPIYSMQSFKETLSRAFEGQLICIAIKIGDLNAERLENVDYNIDNMNNQYLSKYFRRGSLITECNRDPDAQSICSSITSVISGIGGVGGGRNVTRYGPIEYFEAELDVVYAPYDLKMGYQLSCFSHCTHFRATLMQCFDKKWNDIECMNVDREGDDESILDCYRLCSGEKAVVGFNVIDKNIVLMDYEEYPSLGWIVIKDNKSYIIGIGKILYCGKRVPAGMIEEAIAEIASPSLTPAIIAIIAGYARCGK